MSHAKTQSSQASQRVPLIERDLTQDRAPLSARAQNVWFTRALLACGLVAPVITITVIAIMAARTPGYSHVSNTVSDLAAQGVPDAAIMMAGIVVVGLIIDLFAYGLLRVFGRSGTMIWASLTVFGTAGAFSGLAQDYGEEAGAPRNIEGFLHNTCTIIAVIGLISAMLLLARLSTSTLGWRRMIKVSIAAAVGVSAGGLLFLVASESIQGLVQRFLYLITISWLVATAVTALQTTFTPTGDLRSSSRR
jgi:hypothetical membrane protein